MREDIIAPGDILGGFKIEKELGRGGMGVVFKAHELSLNRKVALKVLGQKLTSDEEFITRFKREAQIVAAMNHPNIVNILSFGEDQRLYYFAMEYIKGKDLGQILQEKKVIPMEEALTIIAQVASALDEASRRGVVHRDLKPSNIMLDQMGRVKVTDFGVAFSEESTIKLTKTGLFLGTPEYASPEQALGLTLDVRSDIYALGAVLYRMLSGKPPVTGDSPLAVVAKIHSEPVTPIEKVNPDVPKPVRTLIEKMMAKEINQRFQTPEDLIVAIDHCRNMLKKDALFSRPQLQNMKPLHPASQKSWSRPKLIGGIAGCALALILMLWLAFAWFTRDGYLTIIVNKNGKPFTAITDIYRAGNNEKIISGSTRSTNREAFKLASGKYDIKVVDPEVSGGKPVVFKDIEINGGQTVKKTVDFFEGYLRVKATKNSRAIGAKTSIYLSGSNDRIARNSTQSMEGMIFKLVPDEYDVRVLDMTDTDASPVTFIAVKIETGQTIEKIADFSKGYLKISTTKNDKPCETDVFIYPVGRDISVARKSGKSSEGLIFELAPGLYDIRAVDATVKDGTIVTFSRVRISGGQTVAKTAVFAAKLPVASILPKIPSVLVAVSGDESILPVFRTYLESSMLESGLKVIPMAEIPVLMEKLQYGPEPLSWYGIKSLVPKDRAHILLLAEIQRAGSMRLRYYGRVQELTTVTYSVKAIDMASGKAAAMPASGTVKFTPLNMDENIKTEIRSSASGVAERIKKYWDRKVKAKKKAG